MTECCHHDMVAKLLTSASLTYGTQVAFGVTTHGWSALVSVSSCRCCTGRNPSSQVRRQSGSPLAAQTVLSSAHVHSDVSASRRSSTVALVLGGSWSSGVSRSVRLVGQPPRGTAGSLLTCSVTRPITLKRMTKPSRLFSTSSGSKTMTLVTLSVNPWLATGNSLRAEIIRLGILAEIPCPLERLGPASVLKGEK